MPVKIKKTGAHETDRQRIDKRQKERVRQTKREREREKEKEIL